MASAGGSIYIFMMMMLISGTANTLLMKFQVMQQVPGVAGGAPMGFDHPFFQTLLMMIGELLCLFVYFMTREKTDKPSSSSSWIFLVPCMCDWTATTLVNAAFVFIPASVVQMTRGAIVIFTCVFSSIFLGRKQHAYHLAGVFLVFMGITLVSLSAFINPTSAASVGTSSFYRAVGITLCVTAQIFQASMLVYEEKIMSQHAAVPPLLVVGMEGLFGIFIGMGLLSIVNPLGIESTPAAFYQMSHSTPLLVACIASIFSIAFFNYSGVTVTQKASAVSRSTIDCSRTILIWAVELAVGWNVFNWLQLSGFVLLACGTMLYNRIIVLQALEAKPETESILLKAQKKLSSV